VALIFVVDSDTSARVSVASALTGLSDTSVLALGSFSEMQTALSKLVPHLIVFGLRGEESELPKLLSSLRTLPQVPRILVLAEPDAILPAELHDAIVMEAPISPEALGSCVASALREQRPSSLFSLAEYLQLACLGGRSLLLLVTSDQDSGYVMVRDGEVWAAEFGNQRGELAVYAMVNCPGCGIECRPWLNGSPPRQLTASYEELLFEAAIRQDHAARGKPLFEPVNEDRKSKAAELVTRGVRAVIEGDYASAVDLFVEAQGLDPRNASIRHRLERLSALGYSVDPRRAAGKREESRS